MKIKFNSQYRQGDFFPEYKEGRIKNEPMLFNADHTFAENNGGPITYDFLRKLKESIGDREYEHIIVDSRVHMLMKGWYPAIPGWHHDDVARTRQDGQPDYLNKSLGIVRHATALFEEGFKGPDCRTCFLTGEVELELPGPGKIIYKEWNNELNKRLLKKNHIGLNISHLSHNQIYYFDSNTFHKATAARSNGWRFFIRASWNTTRKPSNEIRHQSNVYLHEIEAGW